MTHNYIKNINKTLKNLTENKTKRINSGSQTNPIYLLAVSKQSANYNRHASKVYSPSPGSYEYKTQACNTSICLLSSTDIQKIIVFHPNLYNLMLT